MEKNELEQTLSTFVPLRNITAEITQDRSYDYLQFKHHMYPLSRDTMLILYNTDRTRSFFLELQEFVATLRSNPQGVLLLIYNHKICVVMPEDEVSDVLPRVLELFGCVIPVRR